MTVRRQPSTPLTDLLATRFGRLESLGENERDLLRSIEGRQKRTHGPNERMLAEKAELRAPHFLLTGWACNMRALADGRRQIVNILLPGDAIGLSLRSHPASFTTVMSLTPVRAVEAPEIAEAWWDRDHMPGLAAALDLAAAEHDYFMTCQVMRLGRQTAYERIAHLFMELDYRLSSRGLSTNGSFLMPLTQETLGDVVGLSVVHVNRTLQQMRREDRIELARGRLTIRHPEALCAAAEFSPPFLSAPRPTPTGRVPNLSAPAPA